MQSNNPILTRVETVSDYSQPMTVKVLFKNLYVDMIAAAVGVALFFYVPLLQMLVLPMRFNCGCNWWLGFSFNYNF
jgi:hypothetical protein